MKKRVLFVDDEAPLRQSLRRMSYFMRDEWEMEFAESGREALELLAHEAFDVVISDMRMPGMDGAQLLHEVRQHYPQMVRLILSGHSDYEMILRAVGQSHQYLAKPCDFETLLATIARTCSLRELLAHEDLRRLVTAMKTLPSPPPLYAEVIEVAQSPDGSLDKIGELIQRDKGMTAKILQLVNSAFFGLQRPLSNPVQAVRLLGLETVKALLLAVQIFRGIDHSTLPGMSLDTLWHHSMAVGMCAKSIAQGESCKRAVLESAFVAGVLHDIGKLILAMNLPELYQQTLVLAQTEAMTDWEAERALFNTTHAEVGAYLLGLWGLPDGIVEALAYHHTPHLCPHHAFTPLTAVHVANALIHEMNVVDGGRQREPVDLDYLTQVGLDDRLAVWREHCRIAYQQVEQAS
jgi:putative nucleotidyltransferase with HDIG domain